MLWRLFVEKLKNSSRSCDMTCRFVILQVSVRFSERVESNRANRKSNSVLNFVCERKFTRTIGF